MAALTTSGLSALVAAFARVRIVVVGDCMLDEYISGECSRLSPEAPIPVLRVRTTRAVPGGAANTAANVVALGGQAVLVGAAGRDESGSHLRQLLEAQGVQAILAEDGRPTARKVRALGGQQQLLRIDYEDEAPASSATRAKVIAAVRAAADGAAAIVLSDYAKGLVDRATCTGLIEAARDVDVPLIIDPRPQHGSFYAGCDYLTPNWKEAQALASVAEAPASDDAAVDATGRQLVDRFGAGVLLTLGALGMRFFPRDKGASHSERALAREVFDVSGAGDTVVAAFALALGAGADATAAVRLANRAAGIVVGKVGTAVATAAELAGDGGGERVLDRGQLEARLSEWRTEGRSVVFLESDFGGLDRALVQQARDARDAGHLVIALVREPAGTPDAVPVGVRVQLAAALRDVDFVHVVTDTAAADRLAGARAGERPTRIEREAPER